MDKPALRRLMRETGPVPQEIGVMVVSHLKSWLAGRLPGTVAAYLAMADEIDLAPLFDWLPGWQWVLPRVEGDSTVTFRDREVPTERHPLGMVQPVDTGTRTPLGQIDVFLVPGMAFDREGNRLGRGGGFYDGILCKARGDAIRMGVTTELRVVDHVPSESHDAMVQWLATERGVIQCLPTRSPGRW